MLQQQQQQRQQQLQQQQHALRAAQLAAQANAAAAAANGAFRQHAGAQQYAGTQQLHPGTAHGVQPQLQQQQQHRGGMPEPDAKRARSNTNEDDEPNPQYEGETMLAAAHDAALEDTEALALVFQPYAPRCVTAAEMGGPVGTRHPEMIVEAAAMASVSPPHPTYRPKLDDSLLLPPSPGATSRLSDVQFETVVYAGQAHLGTCEPVAGLVCSRGFYIGDGTGVGKGRQIAGVILDNWVQGRRRAVWVSISVELLYDCK
jgi:hypothetical protein